MKRILLDTNAYSFFSMGDRKIQKEIKRADEVIFSPIVLGELYSGFEKGERKIENLRLLQKFITGYKTIQLKIGNKTAELYGQIYYELQGKGTPIPTNDVWIAACAIETDSTLISYDTHFLKIPQVKVWNILKRI